MLHLTSANCTHLPAEGYAGVKKRTLRAGGGGGGRGSPSRDGNGEIRCVRDAGWRGLVRLSDSGCIDRVPRACVTSPRSSVRTERPHLSSSLSPAPIVDLSQRIDPPVSTSAAQASSHCPPPLPCLLLLFAHTFSSLPLRSPPYPR